ncbi:MAG: hypothetical protein FWB80_04835 [Defluviitaleaceae bacterium]|nr:hypothetical protein [Defluviitaleaceae bacterium]
MDEKKIFEAIGNVDEKIIAETAEYPNRGTNNITISGVFLRLAAAACFALVIAGSAFFVRNMQYMPSGADELRDSKCALSIVREMIPALNDVMHIMHNGLASDGRVIEYGGREYVVVYDPDFPHLRTIRDIDEFLGTVMASLEDSEISVMFLSAAAFYREIDGILVRQKGRFTHEGVETHMFFDPDSTQITWATEGIITARLDTSFNLIVSDDAPDDNAVNALAEYLAQIPPMQWDITFVNEDGRDDGWRIFRMQQLYSIPPPQLIELVSLTREIIDGFVGNFHAYMGQFDATDISIDHPFASARRDIFDITRSAIIRRETLDPTSRGPDIDLFGHPDGLNFEWTLSDNISITSSQADNFTAQLTMSVYIRELNMRYREAISLNFYNEGDEWRVRERRPFEPNFNAPHAYGGGIMTAEQREWVAEYALRHIQRDLHNAAREMAARHENALTGAIFIDIAERALYLTPMGLVWITDHDKIEELEFTMADFIRHYLILHDDDPQIRRFAITDDTEFVVYGRENIFTNDVEVFLTALTIDDVDPEQVGEHTLRRILHFVQVNDNDEVTNITQEFIFTQ